jgi:hypothetical protein
MERYSGLHIVQRLHQKVREPIQNFRVPNARAGVLARLQLSNKADYPSVQVSIEPGQSLGRHDCSTPEGGRPPR